MISFLNICGYTLKNGEYVNSLQPVWNIVNIIVKIIMIGVPIVLIVYGMFDLGKAVVASKEEEVKKATKLLGKRFLYAIGVFAVVWIVTTLFDVIGDAAKGTEGYDYDGSWTQCWKCNIRKSIKQGDDGYKTVCVSKDD